MPWKPNLVRAAGLALGCIVIAATVATVSALAPAPESRPTALRPAEPNSAGRTVMAMDGPPGTAKPDAAVAGSDPGRTATRHLEELITARQLIMDANQAALLLIETGKDLPLALLQGQAYQIYTTTTAFPHLFPAESKPVLAPAGNAPTSAAAARIWEDFEAFYAEAMAAADLAFKLSQAPDKPTLAIMAKQLRAACDGCHTRYMHVAEPR